MESYRRYVGWKEHLLAFGSTVDRGGGFGEVQNGVCLVGSRISVDSVEIGLLLYLLPEVLSLPQDMAQLVVTVGCEAVRPNNVARLFGPNI